MTIKYGTDEYGNIWHTPAQIEPVGGTVCYNPELETLNEPIEVPEGKRLVVENGKWKLIAISMDCVRDGEKIRPKTQNERYRDGLDEIPKGMRLVDLELVAKTLEEQLKTNEITHNQYNDIKNQPIKSVLADIDVKSVRSLREWLLTQDSCPDFLKQYEKEAETKRAVLLK